MMVRQPKDVAARRQVGHYLLVDFKTNAIMRGDIDIEEMGRELGVLEPWEHVFPGW
jgi:hypothetical protein